MLEIRLTAKGYIANQEISSTLFEPLKNTVVRVICEKHYYADVFDFENSICSYMSSFMPEEIEVKTDHVTYEQSTGENEKGRYIEELTFQVYI